MLIFDPPPLFVTLYTHLYGLYAKALSEVPIDKTRETTNGALIMNFRDKTNMEKAKKAIDDASNIGTTTKIGNTYIPRIMLTYMNLTKDDMMMVPTLETNSK